MKVVIIEATNLKKKITNNLYNDELSAGMCNFDKSTIILSTYYIDIYKVYLHAWVHIALQK